MLLPIKCCNTVIALELVGSVLDVAELEAFDRASKEHASIDGMFCPHLGCSRFLGSQQALARTDCHKCPSCDGAFCGSCGRLPHAGVCAHEREDELALKRYALIYGWQQCLKCRCFIELTQGCNHVTCRCGNEFCYVCLAAWKPARKCQCNVYRSS
eukprot:jgi/Mesvir1/29701/Mv00934-RA.1